MYFPTDDSDDTDFNAFGIFDITDFLCKYAGKYNWCLHQ